MTTRSISSTSNKTPKPTFVPRKLSPATCIKLSKNSLKPNKTSAWWLLKSCKAWSKGNNPTEARLFARRSVTGIIGNCSTPSRCERKKTVFPSAQSIPIKPVRHAPHVPILSGVIESLRNFSVWGVGTPIKLTLLAHWIFWLVLLPDDMVPVSKSNQYYQILLVR